MMRLIQMAVVAAVKCTSNYRYGIFSVSCYCSFIGHHVFVQISIVGLPHECHQILVFIIHHCNSLSLALEHRASMKCLHVAQSMANLFTFFQVFPISNASSSVLFRSFRMTVLLDALHIPSHYSLLSSFIWFP
jgi:hypothetical protein